ncbi:hypothetical protein PspLS_09263 [Pyricularia sp. CBS 133598]|nr:hypothetical protein PspLS_09263 [Pyricularia sp. CBS 133598]
MASEIGCNGGSNLCRPSIENAGQVMTTNPAKTFGDRKVGVKDPFFLSFLS